LTLGYTRFPTFNSPTKLRGGTREDEVKSSFFSFIIVLGLSGCGDVNAPPLETEKVQQNLTASHEFSKAPSTSGVSYGVWESTDTAVGPNDEVYLLGDLGDNPFNDVSLDFGCSDPIANKADSQHDIFLVKFDASGDCQWQWSHGDDTTEVPYVTGYFARNVVVTDDGEPIISYAILNEGDPQDPGLEPGWGSYVRHLGEDMSGDPTTL
jgi:hypothetical protein